MEPTKLKKVIAIAGNGHGAGKTTLANFITFRDKSLFGDYCIEIRHFSEPLKNAVEDLLPFSSCLDEKDTPMKELKGKTVRDFLIKLGTLIKDEFGSSFLIQLLLKNIKRIGGTCDCVVIDDMRFPEELKALRNVFGDKLVTVYVDGLIDEASQDPYTEGILNTRNTRFDYVVTNYGSYEMLYDNAVKIVNKELLNNE